MCASLITAISQDSLELERRVRRTDLQSLAELKIASALVLMKSRHWSNAYYIAGYSIEFGLKACISRQISADTIPDKSFITKTYTHSITELIGLAGLRAQHKVKLAADSSFASNWAICSEWSPEVRYQEKSNAEAQYLISAATDATHGVLPWIKNYW